MPAASNAVWMTLRRVVRIAEVEEDDSVRSQDAANGTEDLDDVPDESIDRCLHADLPLDAVALSEIRRARNHAVNALRSEFAEHLSRVTAVDLPARTGAAVTLGEECPERSAAGVGGERLVKKVSGARVFKTRIEVRGYLCGARRDSSARKRCTPFGGAGAHSPYRTRTAAGDVR